MEANHLSQSGYAKSVVVLAQEGKTTAMGVCKNTISVGMEAKKTIKTSLGTRKKAEWHPAIPTHDSLEMSSILFSGIGGNKKWTRQNAQSWLDRLDA